MQRLIKVDGKVRTDATYPSGFMDVIDIDKTDEHFRLVYDTKGRFVVHRISREEASYKLCKVKRMQFGKGGIPYIATHDGRTIRYPDPDIKVRVEQAEGGEHVRRGGRGGGSSWARSGWIVGVVRVESRGSSRLWYTCEAALGKEMCRSGAGRFEEGSSNSSSK